MTYGARTLIDTAHDRGWVVGIVSGGFHEVADMLVRDLELIAAAHRLGVREDEQAGLVLDGTVTSDGGDQGDKESSTIRVG